jgi:phosphopantothenoylcysteine decarboxylase/phosphopantothenate--cysteine ligase
MGFAIAAEAARRGAEVTLVAGPTSIEAPAVRELVRVRRASEMHEAVLSRADQVHVVIMAAAVADYTPVGRSLQKMSKDRDSLTLVLQRTPDILGDLGSRRLATGGGPLLVGFAAETEDVIRRAIAKRESKHIDLIVANDVSGEHAGFDVDANEVALIGPEGPADVVSLPLQSKAKVAAAVLDRIEKLLSLRSSVRLSASANASADAP